MVFTAVVIISAAVQGQPSSGSAVKLIRLIVSFGAGGGYDLWARLVARHMSQYLPGDPSIVVENMPGAGGFTAANYLYNQAPHDGSVFALVAREAILGPLTNAQGARFDPTQMGWLGSPTTETSVCIANRSSGITSTSDLKDHPLTMGDTGSGSGTYAYPRVLSYLLGWKWKFVSGYPSTSDVFLAMERGEVDGVCEGLDSIKARRPNWISDKKVTVLLQSSKQARPDLPGVPTVYDLAQDEQQRQAIEFLYAGQNIGRPFVTTRGLPQERLLELRQAFAVTMKDPAFLQDADEQKLPVEPEDGSLLDDEIQKVFATPKSVIETVGEVMH